MRLNPYIPFASAFCTIVLFGCLLAQTGHQPPWSHQQEQLQQSSSTNIGGTSGDVSWADQPHTHTDAAAAGRFWLHRSIAAARTLLQAAQRPNSTAAPARGIGDAGMNSTSAQTPPQIPPTILNVSRSNASRPSPAPAATPPQPTGLGDGGMSSISAQIPPQIPPTVLNVSRSNVTRPAPAPAPTSAAAGEASTPAPWTGPRIKSVSEVTAGDSCVCWTPEWCTCGWQSCPYKPPEQAAVLSESAKVLFAPDVLPQLQLSADAQGPKSAPPLSRTMLQRFNKRISTQLINPLYQFTTQHYVLEGAQEVVAAGGDSFKFNLANLDARGRPISNVKTPLDMVRSPSLPYADVFDLPLSMFFMWVFPNYSKPYEETYELATYLMQKYQGTGKQFFIGMWEGDHALRKPGNWGHHVPPDVGRVETLQYVVQQKQRAVDNAKRDLPSCRNVNVWNYIEANFVVSSIWDRSKLSIVNWLVPTIDEPPVDYISYSAYEVLFSGDWKLQNLTAAFDYMAQRLPDKQGVPGPRVFLGEWAYPMYDPQGRFAWSLEESREKGLYAAAVAIAWGSQFNQYWQLFSNHRFNNNTGDRGFWLILPNRQETPIWTSMKDYFAASDEFLKRFWACYGGWPSDYTYRVWAVKTLMKLVNNGTKPEPAVRDLTSSYTRQARVVADNTFGQLGPTITFKVSGESPADAATHASSYIPIMGAVKLADPTGTPISGSSGIGSDGRPFTPPLVPQFLPPGGGNRGRCPIALPMIAPGTPVPPRPSPAPSNATARNATVPGNATAPANAPQPGNGSTPGNAARPGGSNATMAAAMRPGNTTAAAGNATAGNASRPSMPGRNSGGSSMVPLGRPPITNTSGSAAGTAPAGPATGQNAANPASFAPATAQKPVLLRGVSDGTGGVQSEAGEALRMPTGKAKQCASWSKVPDRLQLNKEECPISYPRLSVEDVASGKSKPYTYGGIDRIGCANCQQKGLWPRFCLWRRTEQRFWDSISCNQRESTGRSSVQRNLELAVNISRHWPDSSGIPIPQGRDKLPPGPADITPCDVFRLIRGRTLWIIGDSQMKGLYTALKCFMLEFWDLQQYVPTWNSTTLDYLNKLPRNGEAKCIHLPESTRICQIKVLWADTFAERPGPGETRWTVPVLEVLQQHLAHPADIMALNFGLWYDPKNPTRYYNNLIALGQAYQTAQASFPNMLFLETVKLHWPDPPGDQDGPRDGKDGATMEQCTPTDNVVFDAPTGALKRVTYTDAAAAAEATPSGSSQPAAAEDPKVLAYIDAAAASAAAGELLSMGLPEYQMDAAVAAGGSNDSSSSSSSTAASSTTRDGSSSGRRRRLLRWLHRAKTTAAQHGRTHQTGHGTPLRHWALHHASNGVWQGGLARALLQTPPPPPPPPPPPSQQQQQQRPARAQSSAAAGGTSNSKGPLEDSPSFPQLQPAYAASQQQQQKQQQRQQQQQQQGQAQGPAGASRPSSPDQQRPAAGSPAGSTTANSTASTRATNSSSSSSSAGRSSSPSTRDADPPQFPMLRPAFAVNSSSNSNSSSSRPAGNPSPSQRPPSAPHGPSAATPPAASTAAPASASKPPAAPAPAAKPPAAARPVLAPGFGSVALPPELATDAVLTGLWRNQIARAVLRDRFNMPWVPIYNATVPAYWSHRNSADAPDCIHYCNPGAPQNWMAKLMLAIAVNIKPLEGEIADKRCLWGTDLVYDEGEKDFQ